MQADDVIHVTCGDCQVRLEGGPPWVCPKCKTNTAAHVFALITSVDHDSGYKYNVVEVERFGERFVWTYMGRIIHSTEEKRAALEYTELVMRVNGVTENAFIERLKKFVELEENNGQ